LAGANYRPRINQAVLEGATNEKKRNKRN